MKCTVCGIEFEAKRADAKYCSPGCRKQASRLASVTDNVTLSTPDVTLNFEFYTVTKANGKSPIRTAKYWYDVPVSAVPVIQKGWPAIPDYMNGRQYFLWWKNEFALNEEKFKDTPIIHNPFSCIETSKV